jgi:hypothetical protein
MHQPWLDIGPDYIGCFQGSELLRAVALVNGELPFAEQTWTPDELKAVLR